jgi:aerobic carbon-monoxide dehydrogenase medium subunit
VIPYPFRYRRAKSLAEAQELLSSSPEAKLLAGGQTLIAAMKMRLASPSDLIDIAGLKELAAIRTEPGVLVIGAGVTHHDVACSEIVHQTIPALARLAADIGDPAVRYAGTIGGSVANNDPAADYPAAVLALIATPRTAERAIPADEFFTGMFSTALEEREILTEVAFPVPERAGYCKFRNPASRYAMPGVFVAKTKSGPRVAVTGAGACVFRVPEMEAALARRFSPDALLGISVDAADLTSDIHASAEFRAHLVTVVARRAVAEALA